MRFDRPSKVVPAWTIVLESEAELERFRALLEGPKHPHRCNCIKCLTRLGESDHTLLGEQCGSEVKPQAVYCDDCTPEPPSSDAPANAENGCTVGDLRRALADAPDGTALAIDTEDCAPFHTSGEWRVEIDYNDGVTIIATGEPVPQRVKCMCGMVFTVTEARLVNTPPTSRSVSEGAPSSDEDAAVKAACDKSSAHQRPFSEFDAMLVRNAFRAGVARRPNADMFDSITIDEWNEARQPRLGDKFFHDLNTANDILAKRASREKRNA